MNAPRQHCGHINEFRPPNICGRLKRKLLAVLLGSILSLRLFAPCAHAQPISFTNHGGYYRADPTGSVFAGYHHVGPWTWFPQVEDPAPFWNSNVAFVDVSVPVGEPQLSEGGIISIPVASTLTVSAHDPENSTEVLGTMVLKSDGPVDLVGDLNPDHATLDEQMGMLYFRWGGSLLADTQPAGTYLLEEETGIFAEDDFRLVGQQEVYFNALLGLQLVEGLSIEETMQQAGPATVVGGFGEWVWAGQYEMLAKQILGDVNRDDAIGVEDVDLVSRAVWNRSGDHVFDLDSDGTVNHSDVDHLLTLTNRLNGDADFDGDVQFSDFLILSGNLGQAESKWSEGDFNSDGTVGFPDFLILSSNFGGTPSTPAAVPEPSCLTLVAIALALAVARRDRSRSLRLV